MVFYKFRNNLTFLWCYRSYSFHFIKLITNFLDINFSSKLLVNSSINFKVNMFQDHKSKLPVKVVLKVYINM